MRRGLIWFAFLLLSLAFLTSNAFASHSITYFKGNKKGAVSLTFDDGYPSQVTDGMTLLNARNLKGTFFVITLDGWIRTHVPWETWQEIASQGHEIGSHTVEHNNLTTLSTAGKRWELDESQKGINENVPSQSCVMLAYPYGASDIFVQALASEYYIGARGTWAPEGGFLNHYEDGRSFPMARHASPSAYGQWRNWRNNLHPEFCLRENSPGQALCHR